MATPRAVPITLSDADRSTLLGWTRRQKTAQALALRARIVLAAAEPTSTNTAIAERLHITTMTVVKWRRRFAVHGLDGLARHLGMSQSAISRIWRAFGLEPHRTETFKLSTDPCFIDKVRDVVGLYLTPPDRALVLCVDEKP